MQSTRKMRALTGPTLAALALAGMLVAACSGGSLPGASGSAAASVAPSAQASISPTAEPATPAPTPAPTLEATPLATPQPTAEPTPTATAATASATPAGSGTGNQDTALLQAAGERLSDLVSYRFEVAMRKVNVEGFSGDDMDVSIDAIIVRKPVASTRIVMEGRIEPMKGTFEVVAIGDKGWVRSGTDGAWVMRPTGGAALVESMQSFEPGTLYQGFGKDLAANLERVGIEEHNGVRTVHYRAGPDAIKAIRAEAGLDGEWSVDVWVSEEDGYLIGMQMAGSGEASNGKPGELDLSIELSQLNDPANVVEPPDE